ncbi:MAG: hydrogenase 3 maturation endopeptidase HyCI [Candidatus Omnitrophica bacterium]|nr:hydrogenase 3 maturation endopeptidase HyCI [Candidatus Omnitrophota bacterium]
MLEHLKLHLKRKTVILGIGNVMRGDDGVGSLLCSRIKTKVSHIVYDAGANPENYLGKIIKDKPETVVIVDAVDFGADAGQIREIEADEIETTNFFYTHNSSIALVINYLQKNLHTDIILLAIQPKNISFTDKLSPQVSRALETLEKWFLNCKEDKK